MISENTIAVIGGNGMMGSGIAASSALAGNRTKLFGRSMEKALAGVDNAKQNIKQLLDNGIVGKEQADSANDLLEACTNYEKDLKDVFWVIESITENMAVKQEFFKLIDSILPPDVIITSNTSGMRISEIAQYTKHPERIATTHFWFPGHLVPLVEVVIGDKTDGKVAYKLKEMLLKWNKAPVIVKRDLPGQLANRILQAIIREAINIVQIGLATPEDVDTAVKMGMGIRMPAWGPLEHIDAVGLDLVLSVQKTVLPGISNTDEPSAYLHELVKTGNLGNKTGKGFYDWTVKDMKVLAGKRDMFIMEALKVIKS